MPTAPVSNTVLHNVIVQEPGKKFVQKPKVIETLDFSKVKYAPQNATPTPNPTPAPKAPKKPGLLSKLGNKLKAAGTKLTKMKGGKKALIGLAIGTVLVGAAALLNKCSGDKSNTQTADETNQQNPAQPTPTNPDQTPNTPEPTPNKPEQPTPNKPGEDKPTVPPALPNEKKEGAWTSVQDDYEMLCRDASGRTRDIKGKLEITSSEYDKNPEEFTITDNSSGSDHVYKYKKVGVNDKGQPIYKCISMNNADVITNNQYTLEWDNETSPKLIQHKSQDNYGIGLKFGQASKKTQAPSEKKTDAPSEKKTDAPSEKKTDAPEEENVEIWINRQPGPGRKPSTLEDLKQDVITACQKKRPLSQAEQEKLNQCENSQQVKEYLKSIGINLGIAY